MADASNREVDFSAEGIRSFIIKHGGKVSNVAVVGHFVDHLRHSNKEIREENRRKFKEFMNEVAVVKKDEKDDKILMLKQKKDINYGDFVELPKLVVFQDKAASQERTEDETGSEPIPPARRNRQSKRSGSQDSGEPIGLVKQPSLEDRTQYTGPAEQGDVISNIEGERIIDQKRQIQSVKSFADIFDQEVQTQKEEAEKCKSPARTVKRATEPARTGGPGTETEESINGQEEVPTSTKDDEPAPLISNGLTSSGTMLSISSEASTSCSADTVVHSHQLDVLEHQWMMESAKGNLGALSNLLKQDTTLAGKKDFITGFTALHWGAKHGKKEMIRLVADRGADINSRSQGGYTPLHIAAIHNKESVMQFLIQDYRADVNIRDFSGRKPRHYLKTGASIYMQRKIDPFSCYPPSHSTTFAIPSSSSSSSLNGLDRSNSNCASNHTTQNTETDSSGNSITRAMDRLSFRRSNPIRRSKSEKGTCSAKSSKNGASRSPSLKRQSSRKSEIYRL